MLGRGLAAGLEAEVGELVGPTLLAAFANEPGRSSIDPSRSAEHDRFERRLAAGLFDDIIELHPVLDELLTDLIDRWVTDVSALRQRLAADVRQLAARHDLQQVVRVEPLIGGSAVLVDARGRRVVYKHRGVDMDRAFSGVIRALDERLDMGLRCPQVTARDGYGYMEHVPHRPPTSLERADHLRRLGVLMCVTTLLGSADLHVANVHFDGADPVVLDGEVLLRPRRALSDDLHASVLATGWLPAPGYIEPAGLVAEFRGTAPPTWLDLGTDAVRAAPATPSRRRARRRAIEGLALMGRSTIEGITHGFATAYEAIRADGLDLSAFAETRPRVILRPSVRYERTIAESRRPEVLADPGRHAEVIRRLVEAEPPSLVGVDHDRVARQGAEAELVAKGRFPRFSMPAIGGPLRLGEVEVGSPFSESPLGRARRFLGEMSPDGLADHLHEIEEDLTGVIELVDPR